MLQHVKLYMYGCQKKPVESKGAQTFARGVLSVIFKAKRAGAKQLQILQVLRGGEGLERSSGVGIAACQGRGNQQRDLL